MLGYRRRQPEMKYCLERLEGLVIEDDDTARLATLQIAGLGYGHHPASPGRQRLGCRIRRSNAASIGCSSQEIRTRGDWSHNVAAPGGWCFEYANEFYPDVDDTAMVVMALRGIVPHRRRKSTRCRRLGLITEAGRRHARCPAAVGARRHRRRPPACSRTGCWRCKTAMAAGVRSIATTRPSFSATCRSPITTR